jgi:lipopolysaccharide transport protein LptA
MLISLQFFLFAQQVEITADKLTANENSKISKLIGNVKLKKGLDEISCDELEVKFDATNKPILYTTSGNIHFHIITKTQDFIGKAQHLSYDPKTQQYKMSGNVKIEDKKLNQLLEGEKIVIDRISGDAKIEGGSKPVKFIFDVKE